MNKLFTQFAFKCTVSTERVSESSIIPDEQNLQICLTCPHPDCVGDKCDRIVRRQMGKCKSI